MSRNLLHKAKVQDFEAWLTKQGYDTRPGRDCWQLLQVKLSDTVWACVFSRIDMKEHVTVDHRLESLVRKFIKEVKKGL